MDSEAKTGCCEPEGVAAGQPPTGLPIVIQIGDLAPQTIAYVEHTEGEPIEQFQARLASVLLSVAIGILTPEDQ